MPQNLIYVILFIHQQLNKQHIVTYCHTFFFLLLFTYLLIFFQERIDLSDEMHIIKY